MKRDAIDLSTLNVFTLFRKYFVPTLLGMLSMSAVTAIDGIFVGHGVGSDGIAAVNICVPLLMLFTGIGLMVGAGCSVVASIQLSRGKSKSARLNVTQALLFVTIVALIPSVLMMAFPAETARMLGSSEHLLPMVTDYLLWFVPSWVFQIWITVSLFVIRLDGSPKLAMLCSLITAVINVVLDWLFIFPFGWGGHGSSICHFHQHHGWRTGGDGLSTVLCSAFALTTTQMECQEPAAFRAEYWLPVAYRFFCLIGRGNACCAYVRREPGIYVLSGGRWRRGIRYSVLLYSFCFHGR